jgi:RluA family pseudouridine synthase
LLGRDSRQGTDPGRTISGAPHAAGSLSGTSIFLKPTVNATIKLSSPATHGFWEIPILYEDEYLLALDKPSDLPTSPDRSEPDRPSLMKLLHASIERGAAWTKESGRNYLRQSHRLDDELSGVILLAKSKPVLVGLMNLFGAEKPGFRHVALVREAPAEDRFTVEAKLAPHPTRLGLMHVDSMRGKRAVTVFEVRERFTRFTLLQSESSTNRPHQIRVHLRHAGVPAAGDRAYGGRLLMLSSLKPQYRLKRNQIERPLLDRPALHAEALNLPHPVTGATLAITAPWPKDLTVAVKYLRRYAAV